MQENPASWHLYIKNKQYNSRCPALYRTRGDFLLFLPSMFAIIVRFKPSVRERSQWVGERAIECC
jgi:hypothetical protein